MSKQDWNPSQYYQADFLASHSVQPGSDEARKMTVTSGRKCLELYRKSGPVGSLVRMLLESSAWRSTRCYLTWKASVTPAKRLLFRLVPSTPRTDETVVPFWPTITQFDASCGDLEGKEYREGSRHAMKLIQAAKMWPTPTARDCKGSNSMEHLTRDGKKNHTDQLANAVRMWPTPQSRDYISADRNPNSKRFSKKTELNSIVVMHSTPTARCGQTPCKHGEGGPDLASSVGGQLNPDWVEWLMGFPIGWTSLEESPESAPE